MHECCRSCIFLIISLKYVNMGISIPKDNGRAPKTTSKTVLKTAGKAVLRNNIRNGAETAGKAVLRNNIRNGAERGRESIPGKQHQERC